MALQNKVQGKTPQMGMGDIYTQLLHELGREYSRESVLYREKLLWFQLLIYNDAAVKTLQEFGDLSDKGSDWRESHQNNSYITGIDEASDPKIFKYAYWCLNLPQRICKDLTEIVFGESKGFKIETENDNINALIKSELFDRMKIRQTLPKFFYQVLALGDGVISNYINEQAGGMPDWSFHNGLQCLALEYDEHDVYSAGHFSFSYKMDKDSPTPSRQQYVSLTIDAPNQRSFGEYKVVNGSSAALMSNETKQWQVVLAGIKEAGQAPIEFNEEFPISKFSWVHTGIFDMRYADTPYHNSIFWNTQLINEIETIYDLYKLEMELSVKAIFLNEELYNQQNNELKGRFKTVVNRYKHLFKSLNVGKDQIKEWVPDIRIQAYLTALQQAYNQWTHAIGCGANFYQVTEAGAIISNTATGLVYSYRPLVNLVNSLREPLITAIKERTECTILEWRKLGLISDDDILSMGEVKVIFPDTVIESKLDKKREVETLVQLGMLSKAEGLEMHQDFTPAHAQASVERAAVEQAQIQVIQAQILQGANIPMAPIDDDENPVEVQKMMSASQQEQAMDQNKNKAARDQKSRQAESQENNK